MVIVRAFALVAVGVLATHAPGAPSEPTPVWIDTDPALGEPDRDVDDGFALVQAFHSPELAIRGVLVVFGNAPLHRGLPIAERLVREFGPAGLRVVPGAASAEALGVATPASRAMADALGRDRLTILALGPATNVATLLKHHPDLAPRIIRIVAVAGRRLGQRFTTGTTNQKGHRDFNFELDPDAFRVLLSGGVPLVLAPFEMSSQIWIENGDLDRLDAGGPAARALIPPARRWLALWTRLFHASGFNPFDALAVGYAAVPGGFGCETLPVEIQTLLDDVTEPGIQGVRVESKPYLLVSTTCTVSARALYCSSAPARFKQDLLERLAR
ncbi:MAG: nucleoside hydrolase [Vicinamibacterales bacterium]